MTVVGVGQEVPLIIFGIFTQFLFDGIVVQVGDGRPCLFLAAFRCAAESALKKRALALILDIPLAGKTASVFLDESRQVLF